MNDTKTSLLIKETPTGAFILKTDIGECFALNGTGLEILRGVQKGLSTNDIVAQLARRSGKAQSEIAMDVRTFIAKLRDRTVVDEEP